MHRTICYSIRKLVIYTNFVHVFKLTSTDKLENTEEINNNKRNDYPSD